MNYEMKLNDELKCIDVRVFGNLTAADHKGITEESFDMVEKANSKFGFINGLVDISKLTGVDFQARVNALSGLNSASFDRAAMITGNDSATMRVVEFLVSLSGNGEKFKFFDSKDEAVAWLKENQ